MLKLETMIEKSAKSIDEAKELILAEFGAEEADVEFEVLEEATKGFLGIGSKDAKVSGKIKDVASYKAKAFLKEIFDGMKLDVDMKTTLEGDNLTVELSGDNMGIIIGKRGDTLDGLQYLTSLVVNRGEDDYVKVTLDTENYREKRNAALVQLAERLAHKVEKSGKKYTLEPMNPYERRIIHSSLQDNENVTTFSVGEDPYRKVVIAPKNPVKTSYYRKPASAGNYPRPKKHTSYENFESYARDNEESREE